MNGSWIVVIITSTGFISPCADNNPDSKSSLMLLNLCGCEEVISLSSASLYSVPISMGLACSTNE